MKTNYSKSFADYMDALFALPGWILVRCAIPFLPKTHAWSGKKFHLMDWAAGRTTTMRTLDMCCWQIIIILCVLSIYLCLQIVKG